MTIQVPLKTQQHLEWDRIRQALAELCRSRMAQHIALDTLPLTERAQLSARLQLTSEARTLYDTGQRPPLGRLPDVAALLTIASRGGVLTPDDLIAVSHVVEASGRCFYFLDEILTEAPSLAAMTENLVVLPDLEAELRSCFNERGELSNGASGELYELRHRVDNLHVQLKDTVQNLVSDSEFEGMLQDEYYTIREDRYVLPIRSGHKNHVDGIVHGWSGSGATVFIEPQKVVEANNKLVYAQAEVDREIRRILGKLSQRVGQYADDLIKSIETLTVLDFSWACGELSAKMEASQPTISKKSELDLKGARHPILKLSGVDVVPNDIALDPARSTLVLTGPNTGGKTVALKTVGLCTLMGLSGLHIPATLGSVIPWTPAIFSDIGDEQSLDDSLSTFSGHIANLCTIFEAVQPGTLVMLDELVVGTDPVQGAALAQAILEEFASRGAISIVTTHYENLKLLPYSDPRFRNGAMGFDPDGGQPNYRLCLDAPGASSALQTARRLGLSEAIVQRAGELAGPEQRTLKTVIEELERERDALHRLRTDAEAEQTRMVIARRAFEARETELKARLKKGLDSERNHALDDARKLRDELKTIRKTMRKKVTVNDGQWLETAHKTAADIAHQVSHQKDEETRALAGPTPDKDSIKIGQTVWVISLNGEATIESLPDNRGRCQVRAGILSVNVDVQDLRSNRFGKAERKKEKKKRTQASTERLPDWDSVSPQIPDNTVDLRGMRVDEALQRLEQFLDGCFGREFGSAFIIHGHGTGALKREVRSWLRNCAYVREQRPGNRYEGGDGVTAILLK